MANYTLSSPQPTGFFAAPSMTSPLIDPLDFINMPDVYNVLMGRFRYQFSDALWMDKMGMTKALKTTSTNPLWKEQNRAFSSASIASFAQTAGGATTPNPNNNAIDITLAGCYSPDGTQSYPRVGLMVQFQNGTAGYIYAKNTTTPNAHVISVSPINSVTRTYSQFSSGLFAGMPMFFKEAPKGETDFVINTSLIPTDDTFFTQIEQMSELFSASGAQMTNESWIPYPTLNGGQKKAFWGYGLAQMYVRFFVMRELACLIGQTQNSNTDLPVNENGNTFRTTEGLITTLENRGSQSISIGNEITFDFFEDLARINLKNHSGNEYLIWAAQEVALAFSRFGVNAGANGGIIYDDKVEGSKKLIAKFGSIGLADYEYELKQLSALSYSDLAGIAGSKYLNYGVCIPKSEAQISNEYGAGNLVGEMAMPFTMLFKEFSGENGGQVGRGNFMYIGTGGLSPSGPTELRDILNIGMISHFAARTARAAELVLITK
jgi:hypothetical protein